MKSTKLFCSFGALAMTLGLVAAGVPPATPGVRLTADTTALVMGGTSLPTPTPWYMDMARNQFIAPTHPGLDIDYVPVTTPEEHGPLTGIDRLILTVFASPKLVNGAWSGVPLWKLSGLFDRNADQSVHDGVTDLEQAIAEHAGSPQVIFGYSQGAAVAVAEKRKLAQKYPVGTPAPAIDFVLLGDPSVPNGGLNSRFPGLHTYFLLGTFTKAEPTDTQFKTTVVSRQYDMATDFPLYPLNLVADLNAVMGFLYLHTHYNDVSLAGSASSGAQVQTHGDSTYYFFPTKHLPLFDPLRSIGVPEALIDLVEPTFRAIVEAGYDRSIPLWKPTAARLFPPLNFGKKAATPAPIAGSPVAAAATGKTTKQSTAPVKPLAAAASPAAGHSKPPKAADHAAKPPKGTHT